MQSHQSSFGSDSLKGRGHRRSDTLGKAMPITSLLLNYTPSSLQNADNIRSDASGTTLTGSGDISPTQQERPPLYFAIHESSPPRDKSKTHTGQDTDDDLDTLEQDYEILVSECSSSMGGSDHDDGDRRKSNSEEYISLIGNSKFYAPCLTCVGSAPSDLACQPTAINEMCRRLCTDECRLRLSLAGLVTSPLEAVNTNREMLHKYVQETLETPPQLPPRPQKSSKMAVKLPDVPIRPPANIAIQRKQFLTDILKQNANYHHELDSSDDEELIDRQTPPKELLDIVTSIVVPPPTPAVSPLPGGANADTTLGTQTNHIDPHEMAMLKDFREKFEIAEALAKTSAMTSTTQIKQRLAARKLEMELENVHAMSSDDDENEAATTQQTATTSLVSSQNGNETGLATSQPPQQGVPAATTIDAVTTAADKLTQRLPDSRSSASLLSGNTDDYEPPRDLLLYLVR